MRGAAHRIVPPGTGDTVGGGADGAMVGGAGFGGMGFTGGGVAGGMLSGGIAIGTGFDGIGFSGAGCDGTGLGGGTGLGIEADGIAGGTGLRGRVVASGMQPAESRLQLFGLLHGGVGVDCASAAAAASNSTAGRIGVFIMFSSWTSSLCHGNRCAEEWRLQFGLGASRACRGNELRAGDFFRFQHGCRAAWVPGTDN